MKSLTAEKYANLNYFKRCIRKLTPHMGIITAKVVWSFIFVTVD